jgi:hypothetical protein
MPEGEEWKSAFWIRYGLGEYNVIALGFIMPMPTFKDLSTIPTSIPEYLYHSLFGCHPDL